MQTRPLVSSYFLADILPLYELISIRLEQKLKALKTTYGAQMDIKRGVSWGRANPARRRWHQF